MKINVQLKGFDKLANELEKEAEKQLASQEIKSPIVTAPIIKAEPISAQAIGHKKRKTPRPPKNGK